MIGQTGLAPRRANLSMADLSKTNLLMTTLHGVNLSSAACLGTIFADVDVSGIKDPRGVPPRLRRARALIAYLPSLVGAMEPIQFYSCFISHSSADKDFARRLHWPRMREERLRVWSDDVDMRVG